MYVRRWPRISASSRTPPSDMRTNSRPVARAIDSPIEVLPVPGGPISVRIAPERRSSRDAALDAQLLDRQVLDDAVLDVLEAGVVGVEHLAGVHRVELLVGGLRPRHGDQPVQVGPDHAGLGRLLAHPLEPPELLVRLLGDGLGHAGLGDLRAVLLHDRRGVLAQLALDRLHLLAQEVLALLLVGALADVVADLPAQLQLDEPLALDLHGELEPLGDVERLEDLDLLLEGDVGGVADRVGQRAGLDDRAQELRDALVGAAEPRGSPRPRRGTRARRCGCGRRRGRRRRSRSPRCGGGRRDRCAPRPRRRGRRRRAGRRAHRRGGGPCP